MERDLRKVRITVRKTIRELCPTVRSCIRTTAEVVALVKIVSTLDGGDIDKRLREISQSHGVPFEAVRKAFERGCEAYST